MYKINLSEKFVIAIFIGLNLWIRNVYAQADCRPTGSDISIVELELIPGEILASPREILMDRTTEYISHTEDHSGVKYFQFSYDDETSRLLIMTESSFANYEKEQNSVSLLATVRIRCTNENIIDLYVTFNFEDVNHFAPEFSEDRYEIEIPLPLPTDVNIFAIISERISATDYDLQNNQITFTSDITNQPFAVSTSGTTATMGKEFFANILTTEKILNIRNGVEFKITATDSGTAVQQSSTVDVKLTAQFEDIEITQVPIFTKSLYIGTLDFQQTPTLDIETISLLTETFIGSITFAIDLSDGDYFQLNQNGLDNAIQIRLKDTVTEDVFSDRTRLPFVVTATRIDGVSGRTAVLIDVISRKSLVFENELYTGTIKSDMTIDHDLIKLTDATYQLDVEFSIKEDPLGWFEVIFNSNVNQMTIQLKPTLSDADLEGKTLVSLTISAISASNMFFEGESHVVLGIKSTDVTTTTTTTTTQQPVETTVECDDIGFIVGIVVLAILLLLACITIFGMWWRWVRPYRYMQHDSSKDQLNNDFNDTGYTEPITVPSVNNSDSDLFGKSNFEIKNENLPIETLDTSPESIDKSLQSILDVGEQKVHLTLDKESMPGDSESDESTRSPPKTRKKSIKFNEMVERIDILDDINDKD